MLCSMPRRVVDEVGVVAPEVVEHELEHAVRPGRPERLGEQRRLALVERRGRHLDRRGHPDPLADDAELEPGRRQARDLGGPHAGEIDDRRPRRGAAAAPRSSRRRRSAPRSRGASATAAIVAGAIAFRSATSGLRTRRGRPRRPSPRRPRAPRPAARSRARRPTPRRRHRGSAAARAPRRAAPSGRCGRSSVATTRAPPAASTCPTAEPIAPGLTMPTVFTRQAYCATRRRSHPLVPRRRAADYPTVTRP